MVKIFISVFFCIFSLLFFTQKSKVGNNKRLRYDGLYVYDNKIDTIIPFKDKELLRLQYQMLNQMGLFRKPNLKGCYPDSIVAMPGSTFLHFIMFFPDGSGTSSSDICRDTALFRRKANRFIERQRGEDTTLSFLNQKIFDLKIIKDSLISFNVSNNPYFQEIFNGIIYSSDSMQLNSYRIATMPDNKSHRVYKFISFKEIFSNDFKYINK